MPLRIQVEVTNMAAFNRLVQNWATRQREAIVRGLHECALVVQAEARRLVLQGPKTGRV